MVSAYGPAHWHRPGAADDGEVQLPATPNIDRLAARGTLFDTCVAASPPFTPARSAWYTVNLIDAAEHETAVRNELHDLLLAPHGRD